MNNTESFEEALNCAIRFIKFRPRSVFEVQKKLTTKNYSNTIIEKTINHLQEISLLNDEEFAKMWVNERILSKNFGPLKIKMELKQKGISNGIIQDIIEKAYSEIEESSLAEKILKKKFRNTSKDIDYNKAVNILNRSGFSYSVSEKAVKKMKKGEFSEADFSS